MELFVSFQTQILAFIFLFFIYLFIFVLFFFSYLVKEKYFVLNSVRDFDLNLWTVFMAISIT